MHITQTFVCNAAHTQLRAACGDVPHLGRSHGRSPAAHYNSGCMPEVSLSDDQHPTHP